MRSGCSTARSKILNVSPGCLPVPQTRSSRIPPYGEKFLPQIADLARFASRVLCEGGLLVMLTGKLYLDKVMKESRATSAIRLDSRFRLERGRQRDLAAASHQ